ncbi:MAG: OsmC family protein [Halocynthiibacter sp.]
MSDAYLIEPSIDPRIKAIGIRRVTAKNDGTPRTEMTVRSHVLVTDEKGTDTGPTPLEMALSSLLGCEGVIINRCAAAMDFKYSSAEMDAEGEVDQRGSRGVRGVRPYFNWVTVRVRVHSNETEARFQKLAKNVEYRCPVMNLFRSADVDVNIVWELLPA